jgi:hypothetical protein
MVTITTIYGEVVCEGRSSDNRRRQAFHLPTAITSYTISSDACA